jgi:uncharacterized protein with GYD domain
MATYFLFGKYSSEAVKSMSQGRTELARKLIVQYNGEIRSIHALLGESDLVIIASFPGTEDAVKSSIAISKLTGISFKTSEAIEVDDFDRMITDV